jgi:predicted nucleotidyltransferase
MDLMDLMDSVKWRVAAFNSRSEQCRIKDLYICRKELNMTTKEYIISTIKTNRQTLNRLGIRNVGLFGSYSRDEQSDKSDIDILIDFKPEMENFDNFMAVCDIFEQLFKNEKVEIVTINGLSPYIGPKVLNEVVYV